MPFDCTYPYIFLQCEITKNDRNINKPILESRLNSLIGSMTLFSKFCVYSDPNPLEFENFAILQEIFLVLRAMGPRKIEIFKVFSKK